MKNEADIFGLWPRSTASAASMLRMKALVRSRANCRTLLRVELEELVARRGPSYSLVDRLERRRLVGCIGSTLYVASRTIGRAWTRLLRNLALVATFEAVVPGRTVLG